MRVLFIVEAGSRYGLGHLMRCRSLILEMESRQISVDLFTQKLKGRKLALLEGVVGCFTLFYIALFVWRTGISAVEKTQQGEQWESAADYVDVWPSRWFLPIGTAVMALFVIHRIIKDFRGGEEPISYEDTE